MQEKTSAIEPKELWLMIVNMFHWKSEHQSTELLGYLEGEGLLDTIHETEDVFFAMLQSLNPEKILNYIVANGDYTISELQGLYKHWYWKMNPDALTDAEQKKIDQLLLSVIKVLGIARAENSFD